MAFGSQQVIDVCRAEIKSLKDKIRYLEATIEEHEASLPKKEKSALDIYNQFMEYGRIIDP